MNDSATRVAALLHEAGETHHVVYRIVDGDDPDWPSWYADWLLNLSELPEVLDARPVRSELVWLLVSLDKDYKKAARSSTGRSGTRSASSVTSPLSADNTNLAARSSTSTTTDVDERTDRDRRRHAARARSTDDPWRRNPQPHRRDDGDYDPRVRPEDSQRTAERRRRSRASWPCTRLGGGN